VATFIASIGVTLGGTPAFNVLTGKSGSTADNGVTLTSSDTVGSIDKAGTTITSGDPVWNTATSRNSPATLGQLNDEGMEILIWPGQTLTVYGVTGAAANCYCAINGTVG
jgi:hypothetical protein